MATKTNLKGVPNNGRDGLTLFLALGSFYAELDWILGSEGCFQSTESGIHLPLVEI